LNELAKILDHYDLYEGSDTYKILCPFHGDLNASMQISLHDNFFFCHGCGAKGDAFDFVREVHKKYDRGSDDLKAYIDYTRIMNTKSKRKLDVHKGTKRRKPESIEALHIAQDYYEGLSAPKWDSYEGIEKDYLLKRGVSESSLMKANAKLTYNLSYPIIFPLNDMGVFKGWVCRTMSPRIEAKRKYLYNEGFSRRSTLVGNYGNKTVWVVEGFMDYIKLKQFGVKYAVALLGWKATEMQIQKLKEQGVKRIISALDVDSPGRKGTEYLRKYFEVIPFQYPEGVKDPGDMNIKQFQKAYKTTKEAANELSRSNQSRSKKSRHKQR
jgi:DNA primase